MPKIALLLLTLAALFVSGTSVFAAPPGREIFSLTTERLETDQIETSRVAAKGSIPLGKLQGLRLSLSLAGGERSFNNEAPLPHHLTSGEIGLLASNRNTRIEGKVSSTSDKPFAEHDLISYRLITSTALKTWGNHALHGGIFAMNRTPFVLPNLSYHYRSEALFVMAGFPMVRVMYRPNEHDTLTLFGMLTNQGSIEYRHRTGKWTVSGIAAVEQEGYLLSTIHDDENGIVFEKTSVRGQLSRALGGGWTLEGETGYLLGARTYRREGWFKSSDSIWLGDGWIGLVSLRMGF